MPEPTQHANSPFIEAIPAHQALQEHPNQPIPSPLLFLSLSPPALSPRLSAMTIMSTLPLHNGDDILPRRPTSSSLSPPPPHLAVVTPCPCRWPVDVRSSSMAAPIPTSPLPSSTAPHLHATADLCASTSVPRRTAAITSLARSLGWLCIRKLSLVTDWLRQCRPSHRSSSHDNGGGPLHATMQPGDTVPPAPTSVPLPQCKWVGLRPARHEGSTLCLGSPEAS